jgi:toxin ParE1/3/4
MRIRFQASARLELFEEAHWYGRRKAGLDDEFLLEVQTVLNLLKQFPGSGTPHDRGTRRILVNRFPFSIIYRVVADDLTIYAVAHHKLPANYWVRRLD